MFEIAKDQIPKNSHICHTCDNRKCINPKHLWLGNHKLNMEDKVKKNRQALVVGEAHYNSRLTESAVEKIRALSLSGAHDDNLSKAFGVARKTIYDVVHRKTWKHVA
jgi:hypothetical protein